MNKREMRNRESTCFFPSKANSDHNLITVNIEIYYHYDTLLMV